MSTAFQQLAEMPGSRRRTMLAKQVYVNSNFFQRALAGCF
ncbi:hypothetical protein Nizo1839_1006 [Lactiplantibacillus plantarum]|nr:hypothetical protein SF2A35B_1251 [Lactiplantibacillus plantarum]KZT81715.1 hypothetical protein Nizo1839_1006 [Lactiplantibacillus plantarum]